MHKERSGKKKKKSHFRTHRKLVKEFFFFFFFLGTRLASYLVFCTIFYLHGSSKLVNFVQFFCVFLSPPSQLLLLPSCCGFAVLCLPSIFCCRCAQHVKVVKCPSTPLSLLIVSLLLSSLYSL